MKEKYPEKLRILRGGPWFLDEPPFPTYHRNLDDPVLKRLREKYKLDEVVSDAGSEFEKFLLMKEWVTTQMVEHGWTHNLLDEKPKNALEILELVKAGTRFTCGFYASVFIQCIESLGYAARMTGLLMENVEFPGKQSGNIGHVLAEVWSNEYEKWVTMDCDMNLHYRKAGMPLSTSEICVENHRDGGTRVNPVYGKRRNTFSNETDESGNIKGLNRGPKISDYNHHIFTRNDVIDYYGIVRVYNRADLFQTKDVNKVKTLFYAPQGTCPPIVKNNMPFNGNTFNWTDDINKFNWKINQTAIKLQCADSNKPYPPLKAEFINNMPWFDHYEVSMDGGANWSRCGEKIIWDIGEGESKIMVRAVNEKRIKGASASATVLFEK